MTVNRFPGEARRRRSALALAGSHWGWWPSFDRLENRCVMSGPSALTVGVATLPTDPTVDVSGPIPQPGTRELYQVTLDADGLLVATVHAPGGSTLLSLADNQGRILIESEASSPTNPDDRVAQHLAAGTYQLSVTGESGSGGFDLATTFTRAIAPDQVISETQGAYQVTTADVNDDGHPDLVVPDFYDNQILINKGVGDGTFQPPLAIEVGAGPSDVLAAKLFGDGFVDLVVVDQLSNDLTILRGDGQGNFRVSQVLATRPGPVKVVAADFSGDGSLDLAVADQGANGVEIFHNQGNGTFAEASWIGSIAGPTSLAVANLDGDRPPDLVVAGGPAGNLFLLLGQGQDRFAPQPFVLTVGAPVSDLIAANLSGSSLSDLVAVSPTTGTVSIFHNDGFVYRLRTSLKAGSSPESVVAADFNGDGTLDLAVANYGSNNLSLFLGMGNDQFEAATTEATGAGPMGLASADFNGDGRPDLVTADFIGLTLSVLLNEGDAIFKSPPPLSPSVGPGDVIVADLTNNGIDDLVVPDTGLNEVEIFLGRGDGTFRDPILVPAGSGPEDVAVGDFTGDGIPDLAVVDFLGNSLSILKGNGDGTFQPLETLATDDGPEFIKAADLDRDGHLDLVVTNFLGSSISLFYGKGDGTFSPAVTEAVGLGPGGIAISDLNGDGRPDIAISDSGSDDVRVFLASGPRSFASSLSFPAGDQPWSVASGDFNGDGHPDLVVADGLSSPSVVSVLINKGDGTFLPPVGYEVGAGPDPLAIGDFNGDGKLDLVVGDEGTNQVSLLIGRGDGTFSASVNLPAGIDPYGVAMGDFNGDGHIDLVAVNYQSSDLTIALGNGDGSFATPRTLPLISPLLPTITAKLEGDGVPQVLVANPEAGTIGIYNSQGDGTLQLIGTLEVGGSPSGMVVGDFNGDGRPDLAVTDAANGEVLIFLGLGNGTFQSPTRYAVGKSPRSPILGDFDHDGKVDIAVADAGSNEISILDGRGDGSFEPAKNDPVGQEPIELVIGGIDAQGRYDLGTVNRTSNDLSLLVGVSGGGFLPFNYNLPGVTTSAVVTGDFDGDGSSDVIFLDQLTGTAFVELGYEEALASGGNRYPIPVNLGIAPGNYLVSSAVLYKDGLSDLIVSNLDTGVVTIFGAWSHGKFTKVTSFQVDVKIAGLTVADLNNDGLPDILITDAGTGQVETYLSGGLGLFSSAGSAIPLPHPSPLIFGQETSGLSNIVSTDANGQVLERTGIAGQSAQFNSPVNLSLGAGTSSRDYAVVRTGGVPDVALLATDEPLIILQRTDNVGLSGRSYLSLPAQGNYTRLISGDLFGTGLDDLIVINRTLDQLLIFEQVSNGVFQQYGGPIASGSGPTDVTLANLRPGGLPDLVVANGSTGTVTLIGRDPKGGFLAGVTLPAGLATAGTVLLSGGLERTSPDEPVGVTSGVFGSSGLADIVVVDHGTDRISILQGLPGGGLSAPSEALTYATGVAPIQVVAADLTGNGRLDLVVLNEGSHDISIFLNNGQGGFISLPRIDAGDHPISLSVAEVTGDGVADLVVGNSSGDILILAGNGDGSFQPYERADGTVNLAVGDLTGNGQNDFVLTNTAQDLLSVQTSSSMTTGFLQGRGNGLLAPGPVAIADMNGDGIADLIVTNTGGNDVLVYLGLGGGRFAAPQEFFTGTDPVGLTVADLTGDGRPDLVVANSGSNDVTILLGATVPDGSWTMVPGPRLKAGNRPVSTTVADVYGDGDQDILVVNQDSNTVTVLRGLGGGFFDDLTPLTLPTGRSPVQVFVGHFSRSSLPGIVVLNSRSNNMTYYVNINAQSLTLSSDGTDPVAGVMGDFNNDGFLDIAIANNGDSRIALFEGGLDGLSLTQTILLGTSTRPTGLAVVSSGKAGLQIYVGAAGQDHAISVVITVGSTGESIGPAPLDGGLVNSSGSTRLSGQSSPDRVESVATLFDQMGSVVAAQAAESASVGVSTGGSSAALGVASAVVNTLIQAAQPLFGPSSRTLGWLVENLVQLAQGPSVEILPLAQNEMAAVAVLLSGSNFEAPVEGLGHAPLPIPTEDDRPIVGVSIAAAARTLRPSKLDGFVADLGRDSFACSSEVAARNSLATEFGPEWVWHRRTGDSFVPTANFDDERDDTAPTRPVDLASSVDLSTLDEASSVAAQAIAPPGQWGPLLIRLAARVAATATIAIVVVVAVRAVGPKLGRILGLQAGPLARRRQRPTQVQGSRVGSASLGSKARTSRDLPPWLQGPMSTRHRRPATGRNFATTFFRKGSQKD